MDKLAIFMNGSNMSISPCGTFHLALTVVSCHYTMPLLREAVPVCGIAGQVSSPSFSVCGRRSENVCAYGPFVRDNACARG